MRKRDFLKLLGLAPAAVPLAAKGVAERPFAPSGYITSSMLITPGERIWYRPLAHYPNALAFRDWSDDPSEVIRNDASYCDVPNRLFGAYIKPDGDAA